MIFVERKVFFFVVAKICGNLSLFSIALQSFSHDVQAPLYTVSNHSTKILVPRESFVYSNALSKKYSSSLCPSLCILLSSACCSFVTDSALLFCSSSPTCLLFSDGLLICLLPCKVDVRIFSSFNCSFYKSRPNVPQLRATLELCCSLSAINFTPSRLLSRFDVLDCCWNSCSTIDYL